MPQTANPSAEPVASLASTSASKDGSVESQQTGDPAVVTQLADADQHNQDTPLQTTRVQILVNATTDQVKNKEVVLEKLGRFKAVLNVIKSVGEALGDVSAISRSSRIACSSCVPRFIQQLVRQLPLLDSLSR